jgi:hypothetical protein
MFNDNGSFLVALFELFLFFAWFMCLCWVIGDIFPSRDLGGFKEAQAAQAGDCEDAGC